MHPCLWACQSSHCSREAEVQPCRCVAPSTLRPRVAFGPPVIWPTVAGCSTCVAG